MRILHTSDLHIGHLFDGVERIEEQRAFLEWLRELLEQEAIDILLLSGDIYDHYYPSQEAMALYHRYLPLFAQVLKKVVLIGGNHDSPRTLEITRALLEEKNIEVVSGSKENFCKSMDIDGVSIFACAYVRASILEEIDRDFEEAYRKIYTTGYRRCRGDIKIAMGHLALLRASKSGSERDIYIGKVEGVGREIFEGFDYVALGHFHSSQSIQNIHYSGSPLAMGFKEKKKYLHLLEVDKSVRMHRIEVPQFRSFFSLEGDVEEVEQKLQELNRQEWSFKPFIEVELQEPASVIGRWKKEYKRLNILRVRVAQKQKLKSGSRHYTLTPLAVARELLDDELLEAFMKVLATMEEQ